MTRHILSLAAPDLRGFFAQWLHWKKQNALGDGAVLHYVWQCLEAPRWEQVQQDLDAVALQAKEQGYENTAPWQAEAAETLQAQWWGLLPGMHRLVLEDERLILTIAVGQVQEMLREATGRFDRIVFHAGAFQDTDTGSNNETHAWRNLASALKPLCQHGTQLISQWPDACSPKLSVWQHATVSDGWVWQKPEPEQNPLSLPSAGNRKYLLATYAPHWQQKSEKSTAPNTPHETVVVGAGLAGAAVAHSLARRGWQVTVLDAGDAPAAGASGLPVGLIVPHSSADDTRISQVIRAGIRCSLQRTHRLLQAKNDWAPSGVLEHCVQGQSKLPHHWPAKPAPASAFDEHHPFAAAQDWSYPADSQQLAHAGLPPDSVALWHPRAAWVKPPQLIAALLQHPNIRFIGGQHIAAITRETSDSPEKNPIWSVRDAQGKTVAQAPLLVLAAGFGSRALLQAATDAENTTQNAATVPHGIALNPLRGQVAWSWHQNADNAHLPPFPINGKGSMAAHIPLEHEAKTGTAWITGSTFTRGDTDPAARASDVPEILAKLRVLHPGAANALQDRFEKGDVHTWAGVRATLPDRLPAVGAVNKHAQWQGLQVCCGLGARGLALAMLCGELLAAQLHDEPLPAAKKLATMLQARRWSVNA